MPTTPLDYSIYLAVLAAVRGINATGSYHYDLSTRTAEGIYQADSPPHGGGICAAVGCLPVSFGDGPDLGGTANTARYCIQAWTPAADTAASRILAGARIASDIRLALKTARLSSTNALYALHEVGFEGMHVDGAQLGLTLSGCYFEAELTCTFPRGQGETE